MTALRRVNSAGHLIQYGRPTGVPVNATARVPTQSPHPAVVQLDNAALANAQLAPPTLARILQAALAGTNLANVRADWSPPRYGGQALVFRARDSRPPGHLFAIKGAVPAFAAADPIVADPRYTFQSSMQTVRPMAYGVIDWQLRSIEQELGISALLRERHHRNIVASQDFLVELYAKVAPQPS